MAPVSHEEMQPDEVFHRIGGGSVENLSLKPGERDLRPPGISLFRGGTARQAVEQMRQAFPRSLKWGRGQVLTVGTAELRAIREQGFDIMPDPTTRFPNHCRLIHSGLAAGFSDENLQKLSKVFVNREEH